MSSQPRLAASSGLGLQGGRQVPVCGAPDMLEVWSGVSMERIPGWPAGLVLYFQVTEHICLVLCSCCILFVGAYAKKAEGERGSVLQDESKPGPTLLSM